PPQTAATAEGASGSSAAAAAACTAGGALAGNDSALASSGPVRLPLLALSQPPGLAAPGRALAAPGPSWASSSLRATRKERLASVSGTRSWGRRGPARLGTTLGRSSSTCSE